MSIKPYYPDQFPALGVDFANSKRVPPEMAFTRASTGTYVGADGLVRTALPGEPRFDHNPATGESLGLLVEEARTNLLTYSEQFDNAAWYKSGSTVSPNTITSPDGTQSADSISFATSAQFFQGVSIANGTVYAGSIYVKPLAGSTSLYFYLYQAGNSKTCLFTFSADGSTVSVGTPSGASNATFSATTVGGGWFKLVGIFTSTGTSMEFNFFTNIASQSFGLWGAQIEAGSFPTSYIPTTTSTVTRNA